MKRGAGYIAIDRGIFDHWIARNAKRFKAWQWMIADAAHTPQGKRGSWGVVHVERGELVGSLTIFATKWKWTKSAVYRFLKRLENEGMVRLRETRRKTETPTETPTGIYLDHDISIITICNYDEFQNSSTAAKLRSEHQPKHRPENDPAQTHMFPEFVPPLTTKPINQRIERKGTRGGEGGKRPSAASTAMPKDGQPSRDGRLRFVVYGTSSWHVYADDYAEKKGAVPMPTIYLDGKGKWFKKHGESGRPGELWTAARMDRAEKAAQIAQGAQHAG